MPWGRQGGGRGAECPDTSDQEISADLPGKKGKEKRENEWKLRRKGEKLKMEGAKVTKWGEDLFFFFFFFLFTFQNY